LPGLPNPQSSPKGSRHPTPPYLQTPPATTFLSAFTSRLERVVQQITSPSRQRQSVQGKDLATTSGVELQNLSNSENTFENSDFLGDRIIRNLFPTPSLPLFIDPFHPIIDEQFNGLLAIARPIEEVVASPLNQSLLNNSPFIPLYLRDQVNWNQGQPEIEIGSVELYLVEGIEQFQSPEIESQSLEIQVNNDENQVENVLLPSRSSLPLIVTSNITDENVVRREIDTSHQRSSSSSSSSSSSNPPTPPSPPIQNLENLVPMVQQQRLLNIAPFPYFYGRPGDDPDAYVDRFQIVITANELPQNKYLTSFPGNLVGNAIEWYATLNPRSVTWEELRTTFLT
jgi:hypothetical protein